MKMDFSTKLTTLGDFKFHKDVGVVQQAQVSHDGACTVVIRKTSILGSKIVIFEEDFEANELDIFIEDKIEILSVVKPIA